MRLKEREDETSRQLSVDLIDRIASRNVANLFVAFRVFVR